ncbi:MAG: GAF and ANTAR domain-containing protein [Aeromicrobium erythreum]
MDDDTAQLLTRVATQLLQEPSREVTSQAIVQHAVKVVPGTEHAALTVRRARGVATIASTSDLAAALDEVQSEAGEGPVLSDLADSDWHRSADLLHEPRWPRWGPAAAAAGIAAVLSVPLHSQGRPIGALTYYSGSNGAFADRESVETALLFTVHAANALVAAREVEGLETALTSRHEIGLAQGLLMAQFDLDAAQSFAVLRRVSQDRNVKLHDVARHVVERRGLPAAEVAGTNGQGRRPEAGDPDSHA